MGICKKDILEEIKLKLPYWIKSKVYLVGDLDNIPLMCVP
jgi:hypothetical protein